MYAPDLAALPLYLTRDVQVFALLMNLQWFKREAHLELWDADLHALRATACSVIAKQM